MEVLVQDPFSDIYYLQAHCSYPPAWLLGCCAISDSKANDTIVGGIPILHFVSKGMCLIYQIHNHNPSILICANRMGLFMITFSN